MKTTNKSTIAAIAMAALLGGCATAAPRELVEARQAYEASTSGPAGNLNPADLYDAKKELDKANQEFAERGDTPQCRDHAYIAHRKIQLANAKARTELDRQKIAEAVAAGVELRDTQVKKSQADLATTREQLQDERRESAAAAGEARAASTPQARELERTAANAASAKELSAATAENVAQAKELERTAANAASAKELSAATAENVAQAKELERTAAQLEAERQGRLSAEGKLAGAMKDLAAVAAVKEEARGTVITLSGSVLFASGKSALLNTAKTRLDHVAEALKALDTDKVMVVEGHTDSRGGDRINVPLSLARANAVRDYLVLRGVPADRITAVGMGSTRPIVDNDTAENRANNRRVEIVIGPSKISIR